MPWRIAHGELVEGVREARAYAAERPSWRRMELLARGLRWIDEVAESRAVFNSAALDVIERVERPGRGAASTRATTAGLFALAGDIERAREWAVRSGEVDALYVSGALTAADHGRSNGAVLLDAERRRDVARCDAFIAATVTDLSASRVLPCEASGMSPVHTWDWLELGCLVRARIIGAPAPTHADMLRHVGLHADEPHVPPTRRVVPGAVDRIAITAADGMPVEAVIDREDPGYVELRLDPRSEHFLTLGFAWSDARGYHGRVYTEPLSSHAADLDHDSPDFTDVVDAAADWLTTADWDDRDCAWAARTLRALAGHLPVR